MSSDHLNPEQVNSHRGVDHIGVSAVSIVHDGTGKILLMKRGAKARDEHSRWDLCGGAIEFGESIDEAIKREVKEELCADPIDIKFLTVYDAHRIYKGKKTHWIAIVHTVLVDPKQVKNGEPHKFDEIGWFGVKNLPKPLHSQFHKALGPARNAGVIK